MRPARRIRARLNVRLAARLADVTICTTVTLREQVRGRNPRGPVELLANGVDLRLFLRHDVRTSPDGAWKILSVGRLSAQKNYALLIEAAAHLDNVELHFVGDGPDASSLAEQARRAGVPLALHGTPRALRRRRSFLRAHQRYTYPRLSSCFRTVSSNSRRRPPTLRAAYTVLK